MYLKLFAKFMLDKNWCYRESACGPVGRVVASYTRDPGLESSHWQIEFIINCIEKMIIKKKSS